MSTGSSAGISQRRISDTPIAVIDLETTGFVPGCDRVVEIAIVRVDPGQEPRLVFDTLVNPTRRMAATEIHGITDEDVLTAPRFSDIARDVVNALSGCVVAAYNVYCDIKFLNFELGNAGFSHELPHFCLMYMRPLLGLGRRCKLEDACQLHGMPYSASHVAANDALASGKLLMCYLAEINKRSIETFDELARLRAYKFAESFCCSPFPEPSTIGSRRFERMISRAGFLPPVDPVRQAIRGYWDALKTVLADLDITDEELAYVQAEREKSGLAEDQIRVLHARAFANVIVQFIADQSLDDREARKLRKLYQCLAKLGWAPGQ